MPTKSVEDAVHHSQPVILSVESMRRQAKVKRMLEKERNKKKTKRRKSKDKRGAEQNSSYFDGMSKPTTTFDVVASLHATALQHHRTIARNVLKHLPRGIKTWKRAPACEIGTHSLCIEADRVLCRRAASYVQQMA